MVSNQRFISFQQSGLDDRHSMSGSNPGQRDSNPLSLTNSPVTSVLGCPAPSVAWAGVGCSLSPLCPGACPCGVCGGPPMEGRALHPLLPTSPAPCPTGGALWLRPQASRAFSCSRPSGREGSRSWVGAGHVRRKDRVCVLSPHLKAEARAPYRAHASLSAQLFLFC